MALSRWSPMGELAGLHSAMDKLFSDFIGSPLVEDGGGTRTWYLPLDIVDAHRERPEPDEEGDQEKSPAA